jgi:hypothetical protein
MHQFTLWPIRKLRIEKKNLNFDWMVKSCSWQLINFFIYLFSIILRTIELYILNIKLIFLTELSRIFKISEIYKSLSFYEKNEHRIEKTL